MRLSELFRPGTDTLIMYHYMFPRHRSDERRGPSSGPMAQLPLDHAHPARLCSTTGRERYPTSRGLGANISAVAKAPIERVAAFAAHRRWRNLKLLSAANNSFKRDYLGEDEEGQQVPTLTVFHKGRDRAAVARWTRCRSPTP